MPKRLSYLQIKIDYKKLLTASYIQSQFNETIIRPLRISYKGGNYYLEAKDYLENKLVEILIGDPLNKFHEESIELVNYPAFNVEQGVLESTFISLELLTTLSQNTFWRIEYEDHYGNITKRTVYDPIYFTDEINKGGIPHTINYFQAKCISSINETRNFRIDKIRRIQVIELDSEANFKKNN